MRMTVLGKSPAWQDAAGACSGYLVREGDFTLLLDCGSGVFGELRSHCDYGSVDAILLSHLHADHVLDLVPFMMALAHSSSRPVRRPRLWAPPGATRFFDALSAALHGAAGDFTRAFGLREYDPAGAAEIGPFTVRFCEVPHYIEAFAVDLAAGGSRFTFGADCGPNAALTRFAHGTGLLMVEATAGPDAPPVEDPRGHMTAREAGELARGAGARGLLVTHFSDELDRVAIRREAQAGYGGPVHLAEPGLELIV